jgi:hypothetical protein
MNLRTSFWLVIIFAFLMSCNDIRDKKEENIPFEKLSPESTGIYFSNIITPNIEHQKTYLIMITSIMDQEWGLLI